MKYEASTRHNLGHLRLEVGVDNNAQHPSLVIKVWGLTFNGEVDPPWPIAEFYAEGLSTLIENLTIALQCLKSAQGRLDRFEMQGKDHP